MTAATIHSGRCSKRSARGTDGFATETSAARITNISAMPSSRASGSRARTHVRSGVCGLAPAPRRRGAPGTPHAARPSQVEMRVRLRANAS